MRIFLSISLLCLLVLSHSAQAETPVKTRQTDSFRLHYAMYAGGFQAMTMTMDFTFSAANATPSYQASLHAKPYGVLGHFLPWAGEYSVTGITTNNLFYPLSHTKISQWRDDQDRYVMTYRNHNMISLQKTEIDNGKTTTDNAMPDASFYSGTVDIMTAAIRVMERLDQGQDCTTSSDVFDGKRRFRLGFTPQGTEQLTASRYNMFNGTATVCDVEMFPLKGYKKKPTGYYKIQEAARKRGHLPRVWFGTIGTNKNVVPVKMLVRSEYGAVLVHLQKTESLSR